MPVATPKFAGAPEVPEVAVAAKLLCVQQVLLVAVNLLNLVAVGLN